MFFSIKGLGMIHNAERTGIASLSIALQLAMEAPNIGT
jgi:hypothetical protein